MCCECVARDKEHNDETEAFDMVAGIVAVIAIDAVFALCANALGI